MKDLNNFLKNNIKEENSSSLPNDDEKEVVRFRGRLTRIIFPKDKVLGQGENTYGITSWEILEIKAGNIVSNRYGEVTIKGEFNNIINENIPYNIIAKEIEDPKYGLQYNLIYYSEDIDLTKSNNQKAFLKQILTDLQLKELYKAVEDPMKAIIEHDLETLQKAKGIGPILSQKIIERYEEKKDMSTVYMELDKIGLSTNFINKVVETYKSPNLIIEKVTKKPYDLIKDVDGIGFLTADKIALKGGLSPKSTERIKAYINYYLEEQGQNGDSYVTAGELLGNIYHTFEGKENIVEFYYNEKDEIIGNNVQTAMNELQDENIINIEQNENKSRRRVYLTKYFKLEKNISDNLKRLLNAENHFNYIGWEEKVQELEKRQGFEFTDEQLEGIELGLKSQVCYITGPAGSGKSSLVSGILSGLDDYSFAQTALSGRAAAQLQEITGKSGQTIHRLLGYGPEGFTYNENNFLPYDIIILDELSLVGGDIFLYLIKAIKDGSKLIMLGDSSQLEAIGPLNLAADIMNSGVIPVVNLKKVHRQAKKSGILTTAYDVRNQIQIFEETNYEGISVKGELQDMVLDITNEKDKIGENVIRYFEKYYHSDLVNEDIMKIQILSPVKNRGESCVNKINNKIQELINPVRENSSIPKILVKKKKTLDGEDNSFWLQKKDKIMCIKNNYSAMDIDGQKASIFNGWLGIIENIDEEFVYINFQLSDKIIVLNKKEAISQLVLGYASTVHKMQGSGYPVIIGALDYSTPPGMLTCQLVYTLLTRAKKRCILLAQTGALRKAINTNFVSSKRTFLKEFLQEKKDD